MENYKKIIKKRIYLLAIPVLIAVGLSLNNLFWASSEIAESFIFGFQTGAGIALGMIAAIYIIRYRMLLKNEKKLQLQYNKENDERYQAIRVKAGLPFMLVASVVIIIAGIVAGYFNFTVFCTLIAVAYCQMLACGLLKVYYMRTM